MTSLIGNPQKSQPDPAPAIRAFTLIELALVTVIMLIMISLSTPIFSRTYDDLSIFSCARAVSQMIYLARQRSIFERKYYRIVFDIGSNTCQIMAGLPDGSYEDLPERWGRIFRAPSGLDIHADREYVDFSPGGFCDPAVINIVNKKNKCLSVKLDHITGTVDIHEKKE
ncbi:MAG: hypothetical protein PHV77_05305 [Candidatus Omnitrophica bacterium]|nr:hypothetical protein [Candidatus Omnitrophota bacterium]